MVVSEIAPQQYLENPRVVGAVEALNSIGLPRILEDTRFIGEPGELFLAVARPSGRQDEPLSAFEDGVVFSPYGFACGNRLSQVHVANRLVAEVTGRPVIGVPSPDRLEGAFHAPDATVGWYSMTPEQKIKASIKMFDELGGLALATLQRHDDKIPKVSATAGSLGAPVSLAIGHLAKSNFDLGNFALFALPNVEERGVYLELLRRDFARSATHNGGMRGQVLAGDPQLVPFMEAHGFSNEVVPSKLRETVNFLSYLYRDMFGGKELTNYRPNEALARALAVPSGLEMIERIARPGCNTTVDITFLELDPVARKAGLVVPMSSRVSNPNIRISEIKDVDHAGCNNPYIIGHMATLLVA